MHSIKILLAEDNPDHAELTMDVLKENNILNEIVHVENGEKAIKVLECGIENDLPDLVLLDIKMPKKSGAEVLRFIKGHEQLKHLPTVMLSTSENVNEIRELYAIGANCYISKPVNFEKFTSVIKSLNYYWTITARLPGKK